MEPSTEVIELLETKLISMGDIDTPSNLPTTTLTWPFNVPYDELTEDEYNLIGLKYSAALQAISSLQLENAALEGMVILSK
jgi:hypothetical protein